MADTLQQYLNELETELQRIQQEIKLKGEVEPYTESEIDLKEKIKKVKELIRKNRNTFLIKTKKGYLSSNSQFTDNINLAYTYNEDEAVAKARKIGGWLEELPKNDSMN